MLKVNPAKLAVLCLGVAALLIAANVAQARRVRAHLRVLNTAGKVLADQDQRTGTVSIKTDPSATCFGGGTGGSGNRVPVSGPTALGIVQDAAKHNRRLRPLSVTDHFQSQGLGLGLCGVGGFQATGSAFWYLKLDHVGAQVSGSMLTIKPRDQVLWYLAPGTTATNPDELQLRAPRRAVAGQPFVVRVFAFSDAGKRSPAAGATVTGASMPTAADGKTTVQLSASRTLLALDGADIPSNRVHVCVPSAGNPGACPRRGH